MTQDQGRRPDGGVSSGLQWPVVVLGLGLLAAIVLIIITGHNVDDFVRGIGALFSATGALAGIGAWVKSTQAAKQTNGVLDQRIEDGVHRGITRALVTAQTQALATPRVKRPKTAHDDPPTEKLSRPAP